MRLSRIIELFKPKAYKEFNKFMSGQTFSAYPDGEPDIYEDDVLRFIKNKEVD